MSQVCRVRLCQRRTQGVPATVTSEWNAPGLREAVWREMASLGREILRLQLSGKSVEPSLGQSLSSSGTSQITFPSPSFCLLPSPA